MLNKENDDEILGRFVLGIRALKSPDNITFKLESMNINVPIEAVIMQLEAFLRNIKNGYFDSFDNESNEQ